MRSHHAQWPGKRFFQRQLDVPACSANEFEDPWVQDPKVQLQVGRVRLVQKPQQHPNVFVSVLHSSSYKQQCAVAALQGLYDGTTLVTTLVPTTRKPMYT